MTKWSDRTRYVTRRVSRVVRRRHTREVAALSFKFHLNQNLHYPDVEGLLRCLYGWIWYVPTTYFCAQLLIQGFQQYRPRTLDDLHYHEPLSNRLRSLVRPLTHSGSDWDADYNRNGGIGSQRLVTSRICFSMDLRGQGRRHALHVR